MYARFTSRARAIIGLALNEVATYRSEHVGVEHLLLALITVGSPYSVSRYENLSAACSLIREIVVNNMTIGNGKGTRSVPQTMGAKQSLHNAMERANSLGHTAVNPQNTLLGLLDLPSNPIVNMLILSEKIDIDDVRLRLLSVAHLDASTNLPSMEDDK